jgi:hypothetical protein
MRTGPVLNCLAVLTLLISATTLTRHVIITETACPAFAQSEPLQRPEQ